MPMQIFNAKVRLQENMANEVAKRGLTVPEVILLRKIHGKGGVVAIEHVGYADVDHIDERERLSYEYEAGLGALSADDAKVELEKIFGGEYNPLPEELRDYEGELVDVTDDHEAFRAPVPYASPNAEERGAALRAKRDARVKESKKPEVKKPAVPPVAVGGKRLAAADVVA